MSTKIGWAVSSIFIVIVGLTSIPVFAMTPEITEISFPDWMPVGAANAGHITFSDLDQDVEYVEFDVADGRYEEVIQHLDAMTDSDGTVSFTLDCTSFAQKITLGVTLVDSTGARSEPQELSFTCGRPAIYNFDAEQNNAREISDRIPLNIFILEDGITSLTEGAAGSETEVLRAPSDEVFRQLRDNIIPSLSGVWDQCGLGFEISSAWVVDPDNVEIAGGTLADQIFSEHEGRRVIFHGPDVGTALRQGVFELWNEAQTIDPGTRNGFNVVLLGASILVQQHGSYGIAEGFSHKVWPNYSVARIGTLMENVTPRQMIATLAHELGHTLDLNHPGEDDLYDTVGDHINLMKGSGVAPQPRANLIDSQCNRAQEYYEQLEQRLQTSLAPQPVPESSTATVNWINMCADDICSGEVDLSIEATGFEDLSAFSFASFEYSLNGEQFFEIAVDRRYQDGFSVLWDTTALSNGTYILRAVVTDSKGIRASSNRLEVTIQN